MSPYEPKREPGDLATPLRDRIPYEWNGITFWGLPIPNQPCDDFELYGLCATETWYRLTRTGNHVSSWELKLFRVGDAGHLQKLTTLWSQMPRVPSYSAPELFALVGILVKTGSTWDDLTRQRVDWTPIHEQMNEWLAEAWPDWVRMV